jgi:predicted Kef-type K+ transport protein
MHEIPILINIGVALAAALVGGLLARQARVPPLVGYLVAGMAIGPFTPRSHQVGADVLSFREAFAVLSIATGRWCRA